jgi:hypothetical protein
MTLSTVGLLTVANVAATITTVAQPNITSLGTLTGLTVNGKARIGSSGSAAYCVEARGDASASYVNTAFASINTAASGRTWVAGVRSTNSYTIADDTAGSTRLSIDTSGNVAILSGALDVQGIISASGAIYGSLFRSSLTETGSSSGTCQVYVAGTHTINGSGTNTASALQVGGTYVATTTISDVYGILVNAYSGSGTITNAYGAYISTPGTGTNKIALFTSNLSVGYIGWVPPPTGAIIAGAVLIGTPSTSSSSKLVVNGDCILAGKINIGGPAAPTANQYIMSNGSLTGSAANVQYFTLNPTISCTTSSTTHTVNYYNPFFVISASQVLTNAISLFIDFGTASLGSGASITNAYAGYFLSPNYGTNKFALYAENISTSTSVVPPSNGIYSAGHIRLATAKNLAVNGTTPASTYGLTSNLMITAGGGSASTPDYAFYTDNTTGMYLTGSFSTAVVNISVNGTRQLLVDANSNVVSGSQAALATNATNGFLYIPTSAGAPTGVPTAFTGKVAMQYDTTNNKLYVYNGAWKSVTLA